MSNVWPAHPPMHQKSFKMEQGMVGLHRGGELAQGVAIVNLARGGASAGFATMTKLPGRPWGSASPSSHGCCEDKKEGQSHVHHLCSIQDGWYKNVE